MRVVVFGGASDIGLAMVDEIVRRYGPADVVLAGRPGSAHREQALAHVREYARAVEWVDCDACDTATHPQIVEQIFCEPVDYAIIAFGVLGSAETWRDHDELVTLTTTNVTGAVSIGALVAQHMQEQGRGAIIALSSVAGERVRRSNFVYGASKAAMDAFFTHLRGIVEPTVRILVVRPGAVRGRMIGKRRVPLSTTPQVVAHASCDALEAGKGMIRVPAIFGPIMAIFKHLPRWVADRS